MWTPVLASSHTWKSTESNNQDRDWGTRWWRSRWMWSISPSMDTSGIHIQTQKCMQSRVDRSSWPAEKNIEPHKTWQDEGTRGKNRSDSRTGPTLDELGNWSRCLIPTLGQLSESEEKHLRLRVKQLICGSLNGIENQTVLAAAIHTPDRNASHLKVQRQGVGV